MIRKLESLEVKDGKIILKVRAKPTGSPVRPAAPRRRSRSKSWLPPKTAGPRAEPPKKTEPPKVDEIQDQARTRRGRVSDAQNR